MRPCDECVEEMFCHCIVTLLHTCNNLFYTRKTLRMAKRVHLVDLGHSTSSGLGSKEVEKTWPRIECKGRAWNLPSSGMYPHTHTLMIRVPRRPVSLVSHPPSTPWRTSTDQQRTHRPSTPKKVTFLEKSRE